MKACSFHKWNCPMRRHSNSKLQALFWLFKLGRKWLTITRIPVYYDTQLTTVLYVWSGNTKRGKYHCTIDLLFDLFGLVCFANKNKNCQLSYSRFQTSQTGGQWYSDTSPFSIPWFDSTSSVSLELQSGHSCKGAGTH